jgi:uncharacterized protein (TIGR02145 family)
MNGSTTEGAQGICAFDWHIPSDDDWKILEGELGMSTADQNARGDSRGTNQGSKLKVGGSSGFEAILTGFFTINGSVYSSSPPSSMATYFWSSTSYGGNSVYSRAMSSVSPRVGRYSHHPKSNDFYSVRA